MMQRKPTLGYAAALTILIVGLFLSFSACTEDKQVQAKNMEQIYEEEGIPVKIEAVIGKEFKKELTFNAALKGIKESSAYAKIGDKVEKIYVQVGDYVKKDAVLLTFPTDSPSAQYNQAKVAFNNAKTAFQRIDNLYKSGGISLQERDNAGAAYKLSKANWEAARQSVKVVAPISGYVTRVSVSETDNVKREAELFTISQTDKLKARIWLSEAQIFQVKKNMPAVAEWQGYRVEGEVVQVDMAMNQARKAFQAQVEFANPENRLRPGTTVEIKIAVAQKSDAVVVKRQHIVKEQDKHFVYVVNGGKAEKRYVKTGYMQVLDIEILEGLNPGDHLVTEGQLLLEPGTKVKIVK